MESSSAAAKAAAAKALQKNAVKAFREPEVPGLTEAPTTTDKMAVVVRESQRVHEALEREDKRLQDVWRKVDVDHSGSLDKDEVRQVLEEMGWGDVTEEMADEMMGVIDTDNSGEVDFDEFSQWYASMRKKGRMPSWGRAIAELQRRGGRGKQHKTRSSLRGDAAADQRAAMAMRSR